MPQWGVTAGRLRKGDRDVTLDEVSAALELDDGHELRSDLPGHRFSRVALQAKVHLTGSFPDLLVATPGVVKNGQFHPFPEEAEHCVVGTTWHPIDADSREARAEVLLRHEIPFSRPFAVGPYLSLVADPDSLPLLLDEIPSHDGEQWATIRAALPAPAALHGTLYPYQIVGSTFLRILTDLGVGCLLADEMGLGKTLQVTATLLAQPATSRTLVVAPAALLLNWQRELAQFAPSLASCIHAGPQRTGVPGGIPDAGVIISSYETVLNDLSFLSEIVWDVVVLDEAQQIRNPDAQRSTAVKMLRRRMSIAVTGTPVENQLSDLWSIGQFLLPNLLGTRESFTSAFPNEVDSAHHLGRIVSPITIRRRVAQVASDLPDRVEIRTPITLDPRAAALHAEIGDNNPPLVAMGMQRILCAHAEEPGTIPGVSITNTPKGEHLLSLLDEAFRSGEKVLVFASYQASLDRLEGLVADTFPSAFRRVIDGRTPGAERQGVIDAFTAAPGAGCLLLNPEAAGVGLNIVAANHVVHFNPEWNPARTEQATARAYRRKQERPVFVHHLYYADSVEESAVERADAKRQLAAGLDRGVHEGQGDTR